MVGFGCPFMPLGAFPTKMSLAVDVFCRETLTSKLAGGRLHHRQVQWVRAAADRTPSAAFYRVWNCEPLMTLRAFPPKRRNGIAIARRQHRSTARDRKLFEFLERQSFREFADTNWAPPPFIFTRAIGASGDSLPLMSFRATPEEFGIVVPVR